MVGRFACFSFLFLISLSGFVDILYVSDKGIKIELPRLLNSLFKLEVEHALTSLQGLNIQELNKKNIC